jgi:hypothetical protein
LSIVDYPKIRIKDGTRKNSDEKLRIVSETSALWNSSIDKN